MESLELLKIATGRVAPDIQEILRLLTSLSIECVNMKQCEIKLIFLMLRKDNDDYMDVNRELVHFLDIYENSDVINAFLDTSTVFLPSKIEWAGYITKRLSGNEKLAHLFSLELAKKDSNTKLTIKTILDFSQFSGNYIEPRTVKMIRSAINAKEI